MNVDKGFNPIEQIDEVMLAFRQTLADYAVEFIMPLVMNDIPYEEALERYMAIIHDTDDWVTWCRHLKGIVDDCERIYGMERWWVRSCMNFNLEKEVIKGFKMAWDVISNG